MSLDDRELSGISLADITSFTDPIERQQAAAEFLSSGRVDIVVASSAPRLLGVKRDRIVESLLLNTWQFPSQEARNRIPAKGSTERLVTSATVGIIDADQTIKPVKVVIKAAYTPELALKEQWNLERILRWTNVRTIRPLATMSIRDDTSARKVDSWLVTFLETGIVPVEHLRVNSFHPDQQRSFVNELAGFIAQLGNQGIGHHDLCLRNVALDVTQSKTNGSEFVLLDPEGSDIIDPKVVSRMMEVGVRPDITTLIRYHQIAQGYIDDAFIVASELLYKCGFPREFVEREFAIPYLERRLPVLGRRSFETDLRYIVTGELGIN